MQRFHCLLQLSWAVVFMPAAIGQHPLETRLLAALVADAPAVRGAAAYVLGFTNDGSYTRAIGGLLDDPDPGVRQRAIQALALLAGGSAQVQAAAVPFLLHALHDGNVWRRREAASSLAAFRDSGVTDWTELQGCLSDASGFVRIAGAVALTRLHVAVADRDLEDLLQTYAGGVEDHALARLLDRLHDPRQRRLLQPLLGSADPEVRWRAESAAARLDGIAGSAGKEKVSPEAERREHFATVNERALAELGKLAWHAVERRELLEAARRSRLVLFGELHLDEGPLRDVQREVLRAFAGPDPKLEALGFEPSVEGSQRLVIDAGKALGMKTLSVEPNWEELVRQRRTAERDDATAAVINGWLEQPGHRMFVVRGESHTLPGGYLVAQLREPPLIVLTCAAYRRPLREYDAELTTVGRTWRLGDRGRIYVCGTGQLLAEQPGTALRDWLKPR